MNSNASRKTPQESWLGPNSLETKLARLATVADFYEDGRRVISDGNSASLLSAILHEIDDTVLARELSFRASSDKKLTVVAVNRRLLSIRKANPGDTLPEGSDILGKLLSEKDMASINAVEELMLNFVADIETLTVTAVKTDYSDDYVNVGITTETLAASWMLE